MSETRTRSLRIKKLAFSGAFLALALLLPYLTGHIPEIGKALSPMHIPVFVCGFVCGWPYGLGVGFVSPLLKSVLTSRPLMFPDAIAMAFELAVYGLVSGILYRLFPKRPPFLYAALLLSMVSGRLMWGTMRYFLAGLSNTTFPLAAFWAGAVTNAIPGIICHLLIVPVVVLALKKAKLVMNQ